MIHMCEQNDNYLKGAVRIIDTRTGRDWFQANNLIVTGTRFLFARLFEAAGTTDAPLWPVWGLMLGSGLDSWVDSNADNVATVGLTQMTTEILRKPYSKVQYVTKTTAPDGSFTISPASTNTGAVEYQTPINATNDGLYDPTTLTTKKIREMGLIGGGQVLGGTNPTTPNGSMWSPSNNVSNCMTLLNYKALPTLLLPPDVTFLISWTLSF